MCMEMCQSHWDMLRDEVKAQGLYNLVSANGEIATMKMVAEIQKAGTEEPERVEDFDPLMRCHWMITERTLGMVGPAAFMPEFGCPICFFNSKRTPEGACSCDKPDCGATAPGSIPDFETWLVGPNSCVASVREMCIEYGWIT